VVPEAADRVIQALEGFGSLLCCFTVLPGGGKQDEADVEKVAYGPVEQVQLLLTMRIRDGRRHFGEVLFGEVLMVRGQGSAELEWDDGCRLGPSLDLATARERSPVIPQAQCACLCLVRAVGSAQSADRRDRAMGVGRGLGRGFLAP